MKKGRKSMRKFKLWLKLGVILLAVFVVGYLIFTMGKV